MKKKVKKSPQGKKIIKLGDILEHRRSGRVRTVIKVGEHHFVLENHEMGISVHTGISKRVAKSDYKPIGITLKQNKKEKKELKK